MQVLARDMALRVVQMTLAVDCACEETYFVHDGVFLVEARELSERRRFPFRTQSFVMMTMGRGVVISCSSDRLPWVYAHLSKRDRDELFSLSTLALVAAFVARDQQYLAGPDLKYVCAGDTFRAASPPKPVTIDVVPRARMREVYAYPGFHHALSYRLESPRPDMLAAVAQHHGMVIGIAGASADSNDLWQIGVDVRPDYQGQGMGKALVSQVTESILAEGKVPYYSTSVSNVRSSNVALSVGYWLAWTEIYAR